MTRNTKQKLASGFMLVEILVAVCIITASVIAVTIVAQKSIAVSRQAFNSSQAGFLLEEGAEAVRILRDNAWSNISALTVGTTYYPTFTGGTWTMSTTPNTVGSFTRTVVVASVNRDSSTKDIVSSGGSVDSGTKLVTVTVSWVEGADTVTKTLQFYVINIFS